MASIGTAFVTIAPSFKGMQRDVAKQLNGQLTPQGAKAGKSYGEKFSSFAGKAVQRGALAAGAGTVALVGTALVKGFGRLRSIENAEAKLTGLGHTTKGVAAIMDNALASVKGTAFGMDEAASTAAGAVAAGVKPGKDLERTLKLVADAATIGGSSMGEMGAIFNKVATSNKVQGEVIAQLSDRGIPVVQLLAEQMGKSGEEVLELSRKGKVGFDDFRKAMESGLGGAALESGKTFDGAMKNVGAALGRIGENVLSGVFPKMAGGLNGLIGVLGGVEAKAEGVGKVIGRGMSVAGEAIRGLLAGGSDGGALGKLSSGFSEISALVQDKFLPAFKAALPVLMPVAKFIINMLASAVIGAIKGAIQAVTGFLQIVRGVFDLFRALIGGEWGKAWDALKQIVVGAFNLIVGVIKVWMNVGILSIFRKAGLALLNSWKGMWSGIGNLATAAGKRVGSIISGALTFVRNLIFNAVKAYLNLWRTMFTTLWSIVRNGWKVLRSAFGGALAAIRTVITQAVKAFVGFWRGLFSTMRSTAASGMKRVKDAVGSVLGAIQRGFQRAVDGIGNIWGKLRSAASKPVEFLVNTVYMEGIRKLVNKIPGAPNLPAMHFGGTPTAAPRTRRTGGVTAMAQGGVLPGYTPGRDVHHFVDPRTGRRLSLSGGEAVMRPEFTRAIGGEKGVRELNKRAMHGRLDGDLSFFLGGMVPLDFMSSARRHGSGYPFASWAGDLNGSRDTANPPAAVRAWKAGTVALVRRMTTSYGKHVVVNHGGQNSLYAHLSSIATRVGQLLGPGQMIGRVGSTGNSSGPHLHFEVRGGSVSGGTGAGSGGDSSILDKFSGAIGAAKDFAGKIKGWLGKFGSMGVWGGIIKGAATSALGDLRKWVNDKIPGPGPIPGLGIFDSGGMLPPGLSLAYNGTGRNEHAGILTTDQWRTLRANADRGPQQPTVHLEHVHVTNLDELMRRQRAEQHRATVLMGGY